MFLREPQSNYLSIQETGGTRRPARKALVVPVGVQCDAHGNIPRGRLSELRASKRKVFVGKVRGHGGFWQRSGMGSRQLQLLAAFKQSATYRPRLGFRDRLEATVRAQLPRALRATLASAIATARRG